MRDSAFSTAMSEMTRIKTNNERIPLFMGTETQHRQLICASHLSDGHPGLTWLSEGPKSRSWWAELDPTLIEAQPECVADLISELYQGSLNVNGLASPPPAQMDDKLSCFDDHTPRTINQYASMRSGLAALRRRSGARPSSQVLQAHLGLSRRLHW